MTDDATPREVGSHAGLGPAAWWARSENGNIRAWTSAQAEALRLAQEVGFPLEALYTQSQFDAAVAAERERCAAWVEARRDAFCEEHGSIDPDTGTLEFGRGQHADAKSEYVGELEEIAAGLRALKA